MSMFIICKPEPDVSQKLSDTHISTAGKHGEILRIEHTSEPMISSTLLIK